MSGIQWPERERITQVPEEKNRVLILINRKAGARSGRDQVDHLAALLKARAQTVEIISDIEELAERAERDQDAGTLRGVVAAGGDGTIGLVANRTRPGVPLAILPSGTENLMAKYLNVRADPVALCQTIIDGWAVCLDAGEANGRLFLLMLGCGFDAEVVRRLHAERTGHISHLSYAKPIWSSLRSYRYPELRVYCQTRSQPSDSPVVDCVAARWVFVVNLPKYACGLRIAPDAVGTDGLLDVCTFRRGKLWNGLRYLAGVALGIHSSWNDFGSVKSLAMSIESDEPVPYQIDGDPGGYLPVQIRTLPGRVAMLVSRSTAIGLQSPDSVAATVDP